jgi:monoamine oxidase
MSYYVREPRGVDGVTTDDMRIAADALGVMGSAPRSSVADLLDRLDVRAEVAAAVRARIEVSCAWSADDLSTRVVDHVASFAALPSHRVAGGNQLLATAIAEQLGDRVRLSTPVLRVEHSDRGALVVSAAGTHLFDAVVITVPLPLLCSLEIVPPLPYDRREALDRLVMGDAAKVHVGLRSSAPTSAVISVPDRFWCWTAAGPDGEVAPVLSGLAGSPSAVQALGAESGAEVWAARLAEIRDDLDLDLDTAVVTTWRDDPWAQGAYLADGLGAHVGDTDLVAAPLGVLHFAGEHTAGEWSGLMEGALRSGIRAAADVLAATRR